MTLQSKLKVEITRFKPSTLTSQKARKNAQIYEIVSKMSRLESSTMIKVNLLKMRHLLPKQTWFLMKKVRKNLIAKCRNYWASHSNARVLSSLVSKARLPWARFRGRNQTMRVSTWSRIKILSNVSLRALSTHLVKLALSRSRYAVKHFLRWNKRWSKRLRTSLKKSNAKKRLMALLIQGRISLRRLNIKEQLPITQPLKHRIR